MKYQLEITTLLVPVNVHQLFEKCEWPELNSFDREMVENYFSDLVNGIQTDEALNDWKLTIVLYIGTYLGANHISIRKHGITDQTKNSSNVPFDTDFIRFDDRSTSSL